MRRDCFRALPVLLLLACRLLPGQQVAGERKQWHALTLTFDGPATSESAYPNPFLHYRLNVTFSKGAKQFVVPGYFAADGNAAESSAVAGNKWRVHFVPDETGEWRYTVSFRRGESVAVSDAPEAGSPVPGDGATGTLRITAGDTAGRDHRRRGMLRYTGEHYQQYAGTGEYFIHAGSQRPENFLAFDGTALRHDPEHAYPRTLQRVEASRKAGHKWLVGVIEINPTSTGVLPDEHDYWHDTIRKASIWGNLMGAARGVFTFSGTNIRIAISTWRTGEAAITSGI